MAGAWRLEMDTVPVARGVLREILEDGSCPLHLRLQLQRAIHLRDRTMGSADLYGKALSDVAKHEVATSEQIPATSPLLLAKATGDNTTMKLLLEDYEDCSGASSMADRINDVHRQCSVQAQLCEGLVDSRLPQPLHHNPSASISRLNGHELALVAAVLPVAEVLAVRATGTLGIEWTMHRAFAGLGELRTVHDRIRTRLWIQRVSDVTKDTSDETIFETQVRNFANAALRRRMEAEMMEAQAHMERQIQDFQEQVDRRMEEQALRVHAIVEERVQQQLDAILAAQMDKVRAMVEDRVQERIRMVVQSEVHATVCDVQARLASLALENDRLRTAFVEHSDLTLRSLMWALSPSTPGIFARSLRLAGCCRRRFSKLSSWLCGSPTDQRREQLRNRLEAIRRASGSSDDAPDIAELRELWGLDIDESQRLLMTPWPVREAMQRASQANPDFVEVEAGLAPSSSSEASVPAAANNTVHVAEGVSDFAQTQQLSGVQILNETQNDNEACTSEDDDGPLRLAEIPALSEEEGDVTDE